MMKKFTLTLATAGLALGLYATGAVDAMTQDPNVLMTSLSARQRYPWNGKVDIDITFTCDIPEAFAFINFKAEYQNANNETVTVPMKTFDNIPTPWCTNAGTYRVTWDSTADAPGLVVPNLRYTVTANMAKYMIVDMSKGTAATPDNPYPITYMEECPDPTRDDGGWTDEYKTTNMVFRLVQPGTFTMGWGNNGFGDWNDGARHSATITRPYYLAIFECTQGQARQFLGDYPAGWGYEFTGGRRWLRPVGASSFQTWRGSNTEGYCWPNNGDAVDPNSFIGKFRSRTGSDRFDIPTETEWEWAARAGHPGAWWGDSYTGSQNPVQAEVGPTGALTNSLLNIYGRYKFNGGYIDNGDGTYSQPAYSCDETHGTAAVGSYKPNPWGFYDMLGNMNELVLDVRVGMPSAATVDDQGPVGNPADAQQSRTVRGGNWSRPAKWTALPTRRTDSDMTYILVGCRLCWHFPYPCKTE